MDRRNYAKSFDGFETRVLTKATAKTIIRYINKNIFNRNIKNLKFSIISNKQWFMNTYFIEMKYTLKFVLT